MPNTNTPCLEQDEARAPKLDLLLEYILSKKLDPFKSPIIT
jgi:hypothetical protein